MRRRVKPIAVPLTTSAKTLFADPTALSGIDAVLGRSYVRRARNDAGLDLSMSGFETSVALIIEILCGAAGGLALGRWVRRVSLGAKANALIGAIGGLAFTWLAARLPGVGSFVGHVENAADAAARGVGGLTPTILVGVGIAGLLGGIILTALAGSIGNRGRH